MEFEEPSIAALLQSKIANLSKDAIIYRYAIL